MHATAAAAIIYVDDSTPTSGNGLSWATPFRHLTDALAYAAIPANGVTEIRVGQGTYRTDQSNAAPAGSNDSSAAFLLVSGVSIRGGYAGFGANDPNFRNVAAQPTVLTAEIGVAGTLSDNSYSVLRGSASTNNVTLDGLTIRDGYADDSGPGLGDFKRFGGGVFMPNGSLTLVACTLTNNWSTDSGGAIYAQGALTVNDCTFTANAAMIGTGGAISAGTTGIVSVTNTVFANNSAKGVGGAVFVFGRTATFTGCTFTNNVATGPGGYYVSFNSGGAIWGDQASIILTGAPNTFEGNSAQQGGAIALRNSTLDATNAVFFDNDAKLGGAIFRETQAVTLTSCTFEQNVALADGGAIFDSSGSAPVTINGSTFTSNVASRGGAIHGNSQGGPFIINGSTFTSNQSLSTLTNEGGGAIVFTGGTITDSEFVSNSALHDGGAVSAGLDAKLVACTFTKNSANASGGALVARDTVTIDGCVIEGNSAAYGGGLVLRGSGSNPRIKNTLIIDNYASASGGGIFVESGSGLVATTRIAGNTAVDSGGGVSRPSNGKTTLVSCLVSGNSASSGGAGLAGTNGGTLRWVGCTIVGNTATGLGGGLRADVGVHEISGTILWANSDSAGSIQSSQISGPSNWLAIDHSCVQGWTGSIPGAGNIGSNPLFVDLDGADDTFGTLDDSAIVAERSPCLDAAVSSALPPDTSDLDLDGNLTELSPLDLDGGVRVSNFVMDMGAAEIQSIIGPGVYIGPPGGSWFTAANWAGNAVPSPTTDVSISVQVLIGSAGAVAKSVEIAAGGALVMNGSSTLTASSLSVSSGGSLTMNSLSTLTAPSIAFVSGSTFTWNGGTMVVSAGGNLVSAASISYGCGASNAFLRLEGGAVATMPSLTMCQRANLRGTGTVNANVSNGGIIAPGITPATGSIQIVGNYSQSSGGKVEFDVASYAPGAAYDTLSVTGTATIAGALKTTVTNTAAPSILSIPVLTAQSISGSFSSVVQTDPPGTLVAGLFVGPSAVEIGVTSSAPRLFVSSGSSSGGDGASWSSSLPHLQDAILATRLAPPGLVDEIWVASGSYLPTEVVEDLPPNTERSASFLLPSGVALYGGFAGTESAVEERNIAANPTILAGDVLGNDESDEDANADNLFHVVLAIDAGAGTVLDGFIVAAGNADGGGTWAVGAGIRSVDSTLLIRNSSFTGNRTIDGGALFIDGGAVTIESCSFLGNMAESPVGGTFEERGGACRLESGTLIVTNSIFNLNSASAGGAIAAGNGSSLSITGSTFTTNTGLDAGAAIAANTANVTIVDSHFGGNLGGAADVYRGIATISNSSFEKNVAANGNPGALELTEVEDTSVVSNCVFVANQSAWNGGAMTLAQADALIIDCQFDSNEAQNNGGAVVVYGSPSGVDARFETCVFVGNSAISHGGAIAVPDVANPSAAEGVRLVGCDILGNDAASGGGVFAATRSITLVGGTVSGNAAALGAGLALESGSFRGDGALVGDAIALGGQLRLGSAGDSSIGSITASGGLSLLSSTPYPPVALFDLLDSNGLVIHDALQVSPAGATFEGFLLVSASELLPVSIGDRFPLVSGGPLSGSFDAVLLPALDEGYAFAVDQTATSLELVVTASDTSFLELPELAINGEPMDVAAADLNDDGFDDLVVLERPSTGGGVGWLRVLENLGTSGDSWLGYSSWPVTYPLGFVPKRVALADLNGDGARDVAVANETGTISVLLNDDLTGFSFGPTTSIATGGSLAGIAVVDVAGTAAPDIVVGNSLLGSLQIFVNDGAGTFTAGTPVPSSQLIRFLALGDLDNDGAPELLTAGTGGPSGLMVYPTGGTLGPAVAAPTTLDPTGLSVADVDGDGWLDVIVSRGAAVALAPEDEFAGALSVLRNDMGVLQEPTLVPMGDNPSSAAVLDFDGDGDGDIATLTQLPRNQTSLRLARTQSTTPSLTLGFVNEIADPGTGRVVKAVDVDGNGTSDLVLATQSVGGVAGGSGGGVRAFVNEHAPGAVGDINGDGVVDGSDLGLLLGAWGLRGGPADINEDGIVDGADLAIVLGAWAP
ncbi:MAG: VCBS repeat-containing protein [Phycisphaerae bacterium]|nr:VCBS repeat-containing protein [Phycisphaerae bacterium]